MNDEVRKRIIRAAVAWERAMHEKVKDYEVRNTAQQEKELSEAVQAYNYRLLLDDVGGDLEIPPINEPNDPLKFIDR